MEQGRRRRESRSGREGENQGRREVGSHEKDGVSRSRSGHGSTHSYHRTRAGSDNGKEETGVGKTEGVSRSRSRHGSAHSYHRRRAGSDAGGEGMAEGAKIRLVDRMDRIDSLDTQEGGGLRR